jgi:protein gp37
MGNATSIQWTDRTWNPWQGCTKVSPGCAHCYMFRDHERFGKSALAGVVRRSAPATFNAPLKWERDLLAQARGAQIAPQRVFTCSWSDWFHEDADGWRDDAWAIIRQTPHLTYQILTKRPECIADHLPADWGRGYPNVWLGVSAEYQRQANERIPLLLNIPAVVRFVSAEPLLGRIDLFSVPGHPLGCDGLFGCEPRLRWVIVGGESGGREARPLDLSWIGQIVEDGHVPPIAIFVKQLGSVWAREHRAKDWHGGDWDEWSADLRVRQFPDVEAPR